MDLTCRMHQYEASVKISVMFTVPDVWARYMSMFCVDAAAVVEDLTFIAFGVWGMCQDGVQI